LKPNETDAKGRQREKDDSQITSTEAGREIEDIERHKWSDDRLQWIEIRRRVRIIDGSALKI
jgi:hypothetical protein